MSPYIQKHTESIRKRNILPTEPVTLDTASVARLRNIQALNTVVKPRVNEYLMNRDPSLRQTQDGYCSS
jgi:hypothetical protein